MRSIRPKTIAATLALLLLAAGCGSDGEDAAATVQGFPKTLVLGAVPAENSTDLRAGYDPLIKLLEKETGAKVELSQATDYAGVVEGMIAGKVDLAFLGPFAYVIATANGAKIQPLGAVIPAKGQPAGYRSYGLTKAGNSTVNSLADFKGRSVCFVDPGSTSGFLYPSAGLIEAGVITSSREKDLTAGLKPVYAGGHDASALAVKNGGCEAGFAMQSMVDTTLPGKGELKAEDLKKVWTSETIAGSLFVGRQDLGADQISRLTSLLTEKANADYLKGQGMCDGDCLLTDEDAWGVVAAKDADYAGVRQVCAVTKSDKCKS
ncbi:phosphate/phosphite/phosphonate ABC transporter substrate-binding protein [Kribbella sp. CA-293567]|uniref:phosphate/phosphite/phosphonate ABC transporter substrate-binding protein n=1 Tax=Kribbella sp. CA-293567 TaxID=3002436 RepID=UPI0022DCF9B0|nr:phosphate/phosphite/phosphonate ABC transporter substrate-binding protein [Kribbella sp. CA-293567]WBQ04421.1 phosphate/phosphite/phosphonate ABC transporter substrate-binding protein [Kribbella sp. CA-293567]